MSELNCSSQYWKEVTSIASDLVAEAMQECENDKDQALELINDSRLHETIDGHQWVIYYSYSMAVLQHSNNAEYGADNGLVDVDIIKESGLSNFLSALAFWALYADVQDHIESAFDDYESSEEVE